MSPDRGPASRSKGAKQKQKQKNTAESWFDWTSVSMLVDSYMDPKHQQRHVSGQLKPIFLAKDYVLESFPKKEKDYKAFVPMRLHWEKAYLIEEFYHTFKTNFALQSNVHKQYCERTSLAFKACFEGNSRDIQNIYHKISSEFAVAFGLCFDSSFNKILFARKLTKDVVENRFLPLLLENVNELYFWTCKKQFLKEVLDAGTAMFVMTSFDVLLEE